MTLVIIALDGLDSALVERWEISELQLETHTRIETFANMQNHPYTPEVWATVATGESPEVTGVGGTGSSSWDNPLIDVFASYSGLLPNWIRRDVGTALENVGAEMTIAQTDAPTMFDDDHRYVRNWPGVTDGTDLKWVWETLNEEISERELQRRLWGLAAEQFGWAMEMANHEVAVAGVHVHTTDALGHEYVDDEEHLREVYERAGDFVSNVRDACDEVLVLSDHGMCVSFYSDEHDNGMSAGKHSWRAFASSTSESVPGSVWEIKEWVDEHSPTVRTDNEVRDVNREQLKDLGYI
jgi:hypothetical protein